jgi:hypothetical protein
MGARFEYHGRATYPRWRLLLEPPFDMDGPVEILWRAFSSG